MTTRDTIPIGTRKSDLAIAQTVQVQEALQRLNPSKTFSLLRMSTTGDDNQGQPLSSIGTTALFTRELQMSLEKKECDLIVHSLKDVPTQVKAGFVIGAMLKREDPNDVIVMRRGEFKELKDFGEGDVIGTSSVRRASQVRRLCPGVKLMDVRGNVNTRLAKLDAADSPYTCLLLAAAGLQRLHFDDRITSKLPPSVMLHAVGQGSIAIECRADDAETLEMIKPLDHLPTRLRCEAERTVMRILEGGCSVPIGVWTEFVSSESATGATLEGREDVGTLRMKAIVSSLDGAEVAEAEAEAEVNGKVELAMALGQTVANQLLSKGADKILAVVLKDRNTTLVPTGTDDEKKIKGWEMNGSQSSLMALVEALNQAQLDNNVEIFISPPLVYIDQVRQALRKDVAVGAQNCFLRTSGAYTGEVAPEMLIDIGADVVILGHTERRTLFKESDDDIGAKVAHALQAGLTVIACIGETLKEREAEQTEEVLFRQLASIKDHITDWSNVVIAYEPVWAIGTGRVATPEQAQLVHKAIRERLRTSVSTEVADRMRIIYGGSVNIGNAAALSKEKDVDGLFVGGASLKPEFVDICNILKTG
ncbi:porphobilinogen deaminase [Mortierella polycephala]|uniref:Porphobilinogen deaminase n=1 Tax=Mortierella polycephala TaxID=41804 RepID=A0A9P6QE74_9FUNG|nr:porphobilinogen deaminase [Mortierella polycephala]